MLRRIGIVLVALGLAWSANAAAAPAETTPLERRAREILELVNNADTAQARAFLSSNYTPDALAAVSVEERLYGWGVRRRRVGPARFMRLEPRGAETGDLVVYSGLLERPQKFTITIEAKAPHRIVTVTGPDPLPAEPTPVRDDAERIARIDGYVQRLVQLQDFSGVLILTRDGKPVFEKAYGPAERRFNVPNRVTNRFAIGSITKSFTAVALAQLVEAGKVSFDDPLSKYLPDFPSAEVAQKIRLKHLLSHTSGLGPVFSERRSSPAAYRKLADFMETAPRSELLFEPGARYEYSNLGYLLLGRVIEIASGRDYYDYVAEHVFGPAGMATAGFRPRDDLIEGLAYPYEPTYTLDAPVLQDPVFETTARGSSFGGAYASAADLLRFDAALWSGKLIKPQTLSEMTTAHPELGAPRYGYGFSVSPEPFEGRSMIGHGGNTSGVCTYWARLTDAERPYGFVILSNSGVEACMPILDYLSRLLPAKARTGG